MYSILQSNRRRVQARLLVFYTWQSARLAPVGWPDARWIDRGRRRLVASFGPPTSSGHFRVPNSCLRPAASGRGCVRTAQNAHLASRRLRDVSQWLTRTTVVVVNRYLAYAVLVDFHGLVW